MHFENSFISDQSKTSDDIIQLVLTECGIQHFYRTCTIDDTLKWSLVALNAYSMHICTHAHSCINFSVI